MIDKIVIGEGVMITESNVKLFMFICTLPIDPIANKFEEEKGM